MSEVETLEHMLDYGHEIAGCTQDELRKMGLRKAMLRKAEWFLRQCQQWKFELGVWRDLVVDVASPEVLDWLDAQIMKEADQEVKWVSLITSLESVVK